MKFEVESIKGRWRYAYDSFKLFLNPNQSFVGIYYFRKALLSIYKLIWDFVRFIKCILFLNKNVKSQTYC